MYYVGMRSREKTLVFFLLVYVFISSFLSLSLFFFCLFSSPFFHPLLSLSGVGWVWILIWFLLLPILLAGLGL